MYTKDDGRRMTSKGRENLGLNKDVVAFLSLVKEL